LEVDRDDKRELLTLKVTNRDGATYPANSLSDGTLRFLALTVLEMDTRAHGVVCLEEPENGMKQTTARFLPIGPGSIP
jgi:predicted ATPase